MSDDAELISFATELQQQVIARAEQEGMEQLREEPFTEIMIEYLREAGEFEDGLACQHRGHGVQVNGYCVSEDEECLDLFVSHCTSAVPPETVLKRDVDALLKRLLGFLTKSLNGYAREMEEASPAFDLAQRIEELKDSLSRLRLFLFTDGLTTMEEIPNITLNGMEISYHLWDIRRLYRCWSSGTRREAIGIDFMSLFGEPIPCLPCSPPGGEYISYLACLTGPVLVELYSRFGPRLLERNVRCFLQARGNVNKGIRATILGDPEMFLAYNNGLSATAQRVETAQLPNGGIGIARTLDFQIVNGGQTTGSIYHAFRKDDADVSSVSVPLKLTVLTDSSQIETVVPNISRYANSQNKVNTADFSANNPFHLAIEELSRTIWAPPADGSQRQTRWYYERARGQYQDDKNRNRTQAMRKQFETIHPSSQMFTKTDLAKFENTWAQLPHVVSKGAQKNFVDFTVRLDSRGRIEVDERFFRRQVAKAILFRQAEKIIQRQQYGGYRANIVTYTVALIARLTAQRIDLDRIWREQRLTPELAGVIRDVSLDVHRHITQPPSGGNITEWCKKEACWEQLCEQDISLPAVFTTQLLDAEDKDKGIGDAGIETLTAEEKKLIGAITKVAPDVWFRISKWAKETDNLNGFQRSLAYNMGKIVASGRKPSRKQAVQAWKLLEESGRLGCKFTTDGL